MPNNPAQAQDEARRKLIEESEARRNLADALEATAAYSGGTATDLAVLTYAHLPMILADLRADPARDAEEMRERVEDTLTEWSRPSAIRLMIAETMTAQEGRTANAVAAMLSAKIRAAIRALPASDEGGGE